MKKRLITCSALLACSILSVGAMAARASRSFSGYQTSGEGSYSLKFDKSTNVFVSGGTSKTVQTKLGNNVEFGYSNYSASSGNWGSLSNYGTFYNITPITGLRSFKCVTSSYSLVLSYGWALNDYEVKNVSIKPGQTFSFDFSGDSPTFFCVKAGSSSTQAIASMEVEYDCQASVKPATPGLSYTLLSNGTYELSSFKGSSVNVTIPSTHNGKPVTSIGAAAFANIYSIESVEIPSSIVSIGQSAFSGCSKLGFIRIPRSVEAIDSNAFYRNSKLSVIACEAEEKPAGWHGQWNATDDSYLVRPAVWGYQSHDETSGGIRYAIGKAKGSSYVEIIGYSGSTSALSIPSNIASIPVTKIGEGAFNQQSTVKTIFIPSTVTDIEDCAFAYSSVVTANLSEGLKTIGMNAFEFSTLANVILPNSLTSISDGAFASTSITSIGLPNAITALPPRAFGGCKSLASIDFPANLTSIGRDCFSGDTALTSLALPSSLTSISGWAFNGCSSLAKAVIPASVTSMEGYAFGSCGSAVLLCSASSRPSGWSSTWNDGTPNVVWNYVSDAVDSAGYHYAIVSVDGVEYAHVITNTDKTLASIALPSTIGGRPVRSIGYRAFKGFTKLTSFTCPARLESIGRYAFDSVKLTSMKLNQGLKEIEGYAFSGVSTLKTIFIPISVETIGSYAFYSCSSLSISCAASAKPSGWSSSWNSGNRPVTWGATA